VVRIFLLLVLIAVIAALIWRPRARRARTRPPLESRRMVQCAVCSVYVPEDEAIAGEGQQFRCRSHQLPPADGDAR
jgi:hypothetical protein